MKFNAFNTSIASDFDLKITKSTENPTFFFRRTKIVLPKKLYKTKINRYDTTAYFAQIENSYFLHWPKLFTFEITDKNEILYDAESKINYDLLRIFILSEALGILLFRNNYFLLHASAVKIKNHATVFIGTPGAGKSTTIAGFAKEKFDILSDDLVAIKIDNDGKPWVVSAYPEIKIWKDAATGLNWSIDDLEPAWEGKEKYLLKGENCPFKVQEVPLTQIIVLKKPNSKSSGRIKPTEIPILLLKYFALPHQLINGQAAINHFINSLKIAENTSIEYLKRPKDFEELLAYIQGLK